MSFSRVVQSNGLSAARFVARRHASTGNLTLKNLETRWATLSSAERSQITKQLEEAQLKDWKQLSLEEKRAAYYVAFGPHGPRQPLTQPGHASKVVGGVSVVLAVSAAIMYELRANGKETPHTMEPEWREKTNEYLRSQNSNPISGISSEGYTGKGY